MSARNGDRARFFREKKRARLRRMRNRLVKAALARPAPPAGEGLRAVVKEGGAQ